MIGLKAPGKYSDQFWSNQISVLLLERPKPPNSMISGFLDAWDPLVIDLNIQQRFFKNIRKVMELLIEKYVCKSVNLKF